MRLMLITYALVEKKITFCSQVLFEAMANNKTALKWKLNTTNECYRSRNEPYSRQLQ